MLSNLGKNKKFFFIALFKWGAIFIGMGVFLPGCVKRSASAPNDTINNHIALHEYQARLTDIPFPVDAVVKQGSTVAGKDGMQWVVTCTSKLSQVALKDFYHQEMEQLGWRELVIFTSDHPSLVLLFEKPRKTSVITIEQHNRINQIRYHIAQR